MENALQKISCPVCGKAASHLYVKEGYRIARCGACCTLFVENPPGDTSDIYDESYFFGGASGGGYGSYDEEKEMMRTTFERCLDLIATNQPSGSLFDIGAATGYFLGLARARGYLVSGVDISPAAALEAAKKGIDVKAGTLSSVSLPSNAYEVVTMFDVLEHVADPGKLLAEANQLLAPEGILFGSTPDSLSLNARLMGKRWHMLFPPEHLVLMNDKSLRLLFERKGFDVLWTGRVTKWFSLPYILQTAARWLKIPFLSRLGMHLRGTWLGRVAIPLDLRDNLFFMVRKREQSKA